MNTPRLEQVSFEPGGMVVEDTEGDTCRSEITEASAMTRF